MNRLQIDAITKHFSTLLADNQPDIETIRPRRSYELIFVEISCRQRSVKISRILKSSSNRLSGRKLASIELNTIQSDSVGAFIKLTLQTINAERYQQQLTIINGRPIERISISFGLRCSQTTPTYVLRIAKL